MRDESALARFLRSEKPLLAIVVLAGVVIPGLLRHWLGLLGYDALGTAVFVAGYGTMVLVIWGGWIRPLDITGPRGDTERRDGGENADGDDGDDADGGDAEGKAVDGEGYADGGDGDDARRSR